MPVPHDYYGHHSPEPHLHNRHNSVPYIEPDWQANFAKDQLPDISTIGRGPRGVGLYVGRVEQTETTMAFDICEDLNGEVISTIGPFPTGSIQVSGDPVHEPVAGEEVKFYIDYNVYDRESGKVVTKRIELVVPPGAMGSLIYLYPGVLDRTEDDTYQVREDDLRIYNRQTYPEKPHVRVNDIVFLKTHRQTPETDEKEAYDEYWLTFGTVEAVEDGNVVFTARTFYDMNAIVSWDDVLDRPVNVSYWENDADYQSGEQVAQAIEDAVSFAYKYRGTVETYEDLPDDASNGDVYHVNQAHGDVPSGTNWAWSEDEERWDALGGEVSFDGLATEEYVNTEVQGAKDYADAAIAEVAANHIYRVNLTQQEYDELKEQGELDPLAMYVVDGATPPMYRIEWDDIENKPVFALVSTSGSYNDLLNVPSFKTINDIPIIGSGNIEVTPQGAIDYASIQDAEDLVQEVIDARS